MSERSVHMPKESAGDAPGRGRLDGRRVLVVGGGQMDIGEADTPIGNGRAISALFAREGARVAVADRNAARFDQTTEGDDLKKTSEYASQMGVPLFFVGLGDAREAKDLYLHDLEAPESVYTNDNIVLFVHGATVSTGVRSSIAVILRCKPRQTDLGPRSSPICNRVRPAEIRPAEPTGTH